MRLSLCLPVTILLAATSPAMARQLLDGAGCYVRSYTAAHLAKHPDQLVRYISLAPVPLDAPAGQTLMILTINQRGSGEYYSRFAYCRATGNTMDCALEGDGGRFSLKGASKGQLLLTVQADGLLFEGQQDFVAISGTRGDDRSFLIPQVGADQCN